ncbi:hypothetical protein ACRAVF_27015 [Bradyrhizobium oligotrophicum S58]
MTNHPEQPRPSNPLDAARLSLVQRLLSLPTPKAIGVNPHPTDFKAVVAHVRAVVTACDDWLETVGFHVQENAASALDMRVFDDAFSGAIEGNATYVIEEVAHELRDAGRRAA